MSPKVFAAVLGLSIAACSPSASKEAPAPAEPAVQQAVVQATPAVSAEALTRITDPSTVCMVNDQHMGVAQIPVKVDGKTYYGCCQMCEARLNKDSQVRLGRDPTTQQPVDKATAVLAKDASGKVLYFENEKTYAAYIAQR